jgi:hypothetical protein
MGQGTLDLPLNNPIKHCVNGNTYAIVRHLKSVEVGIEKMPHGLDAWQVTGAALQLTNWWTLLAETYGDMGRVEEGLSILAKALSGGQNRHDPSLPSG